MKKSNYLILCVSAALMITGCTKQKPSVVTIDVAKNGIEVPKGLWGIFYEEINRAGDGGLWPEMIYNMGFEEKNIPPTSYIENGEVVAPKKPSYLFGRISNFIFYGFSPTNVTEGWTLENKGNSKSGMEVVSDNPLNKANPHSLFLKIDANDGSVNLINEGFKGISLVKGEKYDFQFYLRADKSYKGKVVASLVGNTGSAVYSQEYDVNNSGTWTNYKSVITSNVTDNAVKLVLQFKSTGKVWIDYVSLLPETTFKGHGLRQDIAQTLADLKPSFIRWPGGCVVEGFTMENRVNWKESIGDRMSRPGQFDLWGYHNTYNFGYHDYLQFCEDIGAAGMFVVNAGLSCSVRNGDYYEMDQMKGIVQDILDAIEYAIGDVNTKWGAERAKNGHPAPFPLKYIEIGNENFGPKYGERYNMIYAACKAKFPQITYINNNGLSNNLPEYFDADKIEMIDPHYYVAPETFFNTVHLYDTVPRSNYKVYIGEYAVNSNVGSGTLEGALAESAFMFGIEHNSDLVKIASYAPLLENVNWRHWPTNLIRFKNDSVFGRSSYYVQKMFNENRPDVTLQSALDLSTTVETISGKVGFTANSMGSNSNISVKDFTVSKGSSAKYSSQFPADTVKWEKTGSWKIIENAYSTGIPVDVVRTGGLYIPGNIRGSENQSRFKMGGGTLTLEDMVFDDCTISANLKRDSSFNGFSIRFGIADDKNYFTLSINNPRMRRPGMPPGLFGNQDMNQPVKYTASVEHVVNGTTLRLGNIGSSFDLNIGTWHSIMVSVSGKMISCTIDGVNFGELEYKGLQKQYAVAGYDNANREVIVKVVNGENTPFSTEINLTNVAKVEPVGQIITLTSASNKDDNSFAEPKKVAPVTSEFNGFSNSFKMEFRPSSFTILRIKASK
ncbi:MAG: alpha-L-arabinofuranosidase C-terminal domain-containing protein [Bacteroidales bacterium]